MASFGSRVAALGVLAMLGAGCHPPPSSPPTASAPAQRPTPSPAAGHPDEPVGTPVSAPPEGPPALPPSRAHCLRAPYLPSPEQAPELSGWEHRLCETDVRRHALLAKGAGQPASLGQPQVDEIMRLLEPFLRPELSSWGLGPCCMRGTGRDQLCLRVDIGVCDWKLDALAGKLAPALEEHGLGLHVQVAGAIEPRCQPGPNCGPLAYQGPPERSVSLPEGARRRPVQPGETSERELPADLSRGACSHDGECIRSGCGNHCVTWTTPPFAAICPAYPALESAYCGCVEHQCTWFDVDEPGSP